LLCLSASLHPPQPSVCGVLTSVDATTWACGGCGRKVRQKDATPSLASLHMKARGPSSALFAAHTTGSKAKATGEQGPSQHHSRTHLQQVANSPGKGIYVVDQPRGRQSAAAATGGGWRRCRAYTTRAEPLGNRYYHHGYWCCQRLQARRCRRKAIARWGSLREGDEEGTSCG